MKEVWIKDHTLPIHNLQVDFIEEENQSGLSDCFI